MPVTQSKVRGRAGIAAILLLVLLLCFGWMGRILISADHLEKADAIVVLGGNLPFRSAEAARLFREGWAPRVWITAPEGASELEAVKQMGLAAVPMDQLSVRVLEQFGTPAGAIRVLSPDVRDTVAEIRLISAAMSESGLTRVILVTSPTHTRRVNAIWRVVARRGQSAFVHPIRREIFDADHWWATARDRSRVAHEMAGLAYAWLGLPVVEFTRRISSAR